MSTHTTPRSLSVQDRENKNGSSALGDGRGAEQKPNSDRIQVYSFSLAYPNNKPSTYLKIVFFFAAAVLYFTGFFFLLGYREFF